MEAADRHDGPGGGPDTECCPAVGTVGQCLHKPGDVPPGDIARTFRAAYGEVVCVPGKVTAVGGQRVRRQTPLHAHVLEVVVHGTVYGVAWPCGAFSLGLSGPGRFSTDWFSTDWFSTGTFRRGSDGAAH
ncbi:hypothetical protein D9M72_555960 [compost metagenome]